MFFRPWAIFVSVLLIYSAWLPEGLAQGILGAGNAARR